VGRQQTGVEETKVPAFVKRRARQRTEGRGRRGGGVGTWDSRTYPPRKERKKAKEDGLLRPVDTAKGAGGVAKRGGG